VEDFFSSLFRRGAPNDGRGPAPPSPRLGGPSQHPSPMVRVHGEHPVTTNPLSSGAPALLPVDPAFRFSASRREPPPAGARTFPGAFDPRRSLPHPIRACLAPWSRRGGGAGRPGGSRAPPKRPLHFGGAGPWTLGAETADTEVHAVPEPLAVPLGSVWCPWRAPGAALRTLCTQPRAALK
jgi:hypothetical protein